MWECSIWRVKGENMMRYITQGRFYKLLPLAGLATALFLVLSIGSNVSAQEVGQRKVEVDVSQSKAVIESASEAADKEDKLKIEFDNGSHNFNFEYESGDANRELEAKVKELMPTFWEKFKGAAAMAEV